MQRSFDFPFKLLKNILIKNKIQFKTRGKKGLLSVFRQGSQEPLDPDRRSQRTYKTSSFDSSPEHPMDGAAAMLVFVF